jgi:ketosteroid isomerase-like protein
MTLRHGLGLAGIAAMLAISTSTVASQVPSAGLDLTADPPPESAGADLRATVLEVERAFAATMAERDHAAFTAMIADEAIFFAGSEPLRGRAAVSAAWSRYFEGPEAPFSWAPDQVEVLASGTLALSTGPVFDASGSVTARFQSIWRREPSGEWRIVFDRGYPVCDPPPGGGDTGAL